MNLKAGRALACGIPADLQGSFTSTKFKKKNQRRVNCLKTPVNSERVVWPESQLCKHSPVKSEHFDWPERSEELTQKFFNKKSRHTHSVSLHRRPAPHCTTYVVNSHHLPVADTVTFLRLRLQVTLFQSTNQKKGSDCWQKKSTSWGRGGKVSMFIYARNWQHHPRCKSVLSKVTPEALSCTDPPVRSQSCDNSCVFQHLQKIKWTLHQNSSEVYEGLVYHPPSPATAQTDQP